eukprot:TRINITY_DN2269_c0_g1_i1.p1 TRINITY_DN2269_c0_g1~~TRINITY_DN2269_c0_g1_i1.p1  ORF type:complete len:417 (+),score=101.18 TRINITY_DN2269_c0_g1_i1:255-1505(+)
MLPEVTDRSSPQRQRELYYGNNQFIAKTLNIKRMVVESAVLSEIVPTQPLFSVEVPREDFLVRAKYQVDASPTIEEEKDEFDENFQTPRKGNPRPRYDSVLSAKSSTKRRTIGELSARRETPRRRPHWFWDEYQSHQPLSASATFCLNKTDGIPYVVKSYTRSYVETFGPNFEHFVKFSTDNDNKYLAKYHHYFQDGDSSHLVREHCPKTLRAILDERPRVGEVMVRRVLRHVGKGLTALHSKHLFHLNLKPENILFSYSEKYKLADPLLTSNAATIIAKTKGSDLLVNKYSAPEMKAGLRNGEAVMLNAAKCDIFALGACVGELIAGVDLPTTSFDKFTEKIMKKINCSNSVKLLVVRMLDANPDARPPLSEIIDVVCSNRIQVELNNEIRHNKRLQGEINALEGILKIKRKVSF